MLPQAIVPRHLKICWAVHELGIGLSSTTLLAVNRMHNFLLSIGALRNAEVIVAWACFASYRDIKLRLDSSQFDIAEALGCNGNVFKMRSKCIHNVSEICLS
jgi:hypothetical protein